MKSVLIVAAHPDDEVLGCAGAILRHVSQGDSVHIVILAQGLASRYDACSPAELENLQKCASTVAGMLGAKGLHFGMLPDNAMDTVPLLEVVKIIEGYSKKIRPDVVYTHHSGDVNIDHEICNRAVYTAFRPTPGLSAQRILEFETPSSTEWSPADVNRSFRPQVFVDISSYLSKKIEILSVYEREMRDWPHPRSFGGVEHLARWRGATVGVDAAEAFTLLREILPEGRKCL